MGEHRGRSAKPRHAAGRAPFDLPSFLRTAAGKIAAVCLATGVTVTGVVVFATTSAMSSSALAAPAGQASEQTLNQLAQQREAALAADSDAIAKANQTAALENRDKILTSDSKAIATEAERLKNLTTFLWPTKGSVISQFGMRRHPILHRLRLHDGVDIDAPCGQAIYAAQAGTVIRAEMGWNGGEGNNVHIDNGDINGVQIETGYMHMIKYVVSKGQYVDKGQLIGYVGTTGLSTGCHLHFLLHKNGVPTDPRDYAKPTTEGSSSTAKD